MAGRPKRTAREVTDLEDWALCLSLDLYAMTPKQYLLTPSGDPLNAAWNDAVRATMQASISLERLGDLIRQKAGITEPGPCADLFTDKPPESAEPDADQETGDDGRGALSGPSSGVPAMSAVATNGRKRSSKHD